MTLNVHEIDYRQHLPRGVLDPFGPEGEPVDTPTDRRLLWHVLSSLDVLATTDYLRDLATVVRRYLYDTCEHHWTQGTDYDDQPLRQCLWCNDTQWLLADGSYGEPPRPDPEP